VYATEIHVYIHGASKSFQVSILYGSTSSVICRTTSEVVSGTLHESHDQHSTVELRPVVTERCERVCVLCHDFDMEQSIFNAS
jgi:hypothetical protein